MKPRLKALPETQEDLAAWAHIWCREYGSTRVTARTLYRAADRRDADLMYAIGLHAHTCGLTDNHWALAASLAEPAGPIRPAAEPERLITT